MWARGTCYLIRCRNFAPFIRDSHHSIQVLTDNESCVDAYQKLRQGKFSTSSRVSTFLTTLSKFNVEVCHIKGSSNLSSDYSSRNPNVCSDKSCLQVCTANCRFCRPTSVNSFGIRPNAILEQLFLAHRTPGLPFFTTHLRTPAAGDTPCEKNEACNIWRAQIFAHRYDIRQQPLLGSQKRSIRPSTKAYHRTCCHSITGLLTALHIQLNHPARTQLQKVFDRHFYAINSAASIEAVTSNYYTCRSLKKLPNEVFEQTSSISFATTPRKDVFVRRNNNNTPISRYG